jgi:hypothetical protein
MTRLSSRNLVLAALAAGCGGGSNPGTGDDAPDAGADASFHDAASDVIDPQWPEDSPIPPEIDFPPWLNLVDGTTVAVSWRTVAATTGKVRFGKTAALGEELASGTAANLHHVSLTGLEAGAAYYYEVAVDGTSAVRHGVFVMPGRMQWRFAHSGEFHAPSESSNAAKFTTAIRAFRPHVLLESGDMVDDGNDLGHWRSYMRTSAPWISNVLLLPSHSNHVNGSGGNTNFKDLFVLSENERWYATRYGQVQFFNLDSTFYVNGDVMSTMVPWLGPKVAAAHDGTDDPKFVIASWHSPACSSQYFTRFTERNWAQDNLVATFKANGGVDLIFAAHDKYYERSTITGGIVHVIENVGQVSPEIPGNNHANCTSIKMSREKQTMGLVTVDGSMLSARVVDETGTDFDTFQIAK